MKRSELLRGVGLAFATLLGWVFAVAVHRDRRRAGLSEEGRRIQEKAVLDARTTRRDMRVRKGTEGSRVGATLRSLRNHD